MSISYHRRKQMEKFVLAGLKQPSPYELSSGKAKKAGGVPSSSHSLYLCLSIYRSISVAMFWIQWLLGNPRKSLETRG